MNSSKQFLAAGLAIGALATAATTVQAKDYYLEARAMSYAPADGSPVVPMWGYVYCGDDTGAGFQCPAGTNWMPGPELQFTESQLAGGESLRIHLRNQLPVDTSLQIDTLRGAVIGAGAPRTPGGGLVALTATPTAAGGGEQVYEFTGLRPGAYLYKSGTDPRVQVQMGLYGSVRVDYPAGLYSSQSEVLLFSEIDPAMHQLDVGGIPTSRLSLRNYQPRYFLIDGLPNSGAASVPEINVDTSALPAMLHLVNAGITDRSPELLGADFAIVAQDGYAGPAGVLRQQNTTLLSPGKGLDITVGSLTPGQFYPLFDRRLGVYNGTASGRGMLTRIAAGGALPAPSTRPDQFDLWDTDVLNIPAPGVLANDLPSGLTASLATPPAAGTLALQANGAFSYTPAAAGMQTFSYTATNASGSGTGSVAINVRHRNRLPVALSQNFYPSVNAASWTVAAPGVLAGATDADAGETATLIAANQIAVATHGNGAALVTMAANGSLAFSSGNTFVGDVEFTYQAQDINGGLSNPATVHVVRDLRTINVTRNNNNRLSINGTIRGYGNTNQTDISLQFTMAQAVGVNAANCTTALGTVLGTIAVTTADTTALGGTLNWSFTGSSGNSSPTFNNACNRFNVVATNLPATVIPAGGSGTAVPAHSVTLLNVARTN